MHDFDEGKNVTLSFHNLETPLNFCAHTLYIFHKYLSTSKYKLFGIYYKCNLAASYYFDDRIIYKIPNISNEVYT